VNKRTGVIAVYFEERAFGFVNENQNGRLFKLFLHVSNILSGTPRTGATVLFNEGSNQKGAMAIDVEVLDGGAL